MHYAERVHHGTPRRPGLIRLGLGLAVLTAITAFAVRVQAQDVRPVPQAQIAGMVMAPVPFAVGERLDYRVTFGGVHAGSAQMQVSGIEIVRGRPAYHVVFSLDGGIPFFRVHDRYESWIDVHTLSSLRHRQQVAEGRYRRVTTWEIFPERAEYQKNDEPPQPGVRNPLDDGSFIYAVRAAGLRVGETRRDDRYFRPDRNPVVLTGVRRDTIAVGAGSFPSLVVKPSIRANGLFSENGDALVWFSDDAHRYPVQVRTKFSRFSLTLSLEKVTPGIRNQGESVLADGGAAGTR